MYQSPKTKGSRRRVPLTADTTALLHAYLAPPPSATAGPNAPLFPAIRLGPGGSRLGTAAGAAALSVAEVEARLVLGLGAAVPGTRRFTSACLRRLRPGPTDLVAGLPKGLVFHSLRHTYVSLCVAAGIPPLGDQPVRRAQHGDDDAGDLRAPVRGLTTRQPCRRLARWAPLRKARLMPARRVTSCRFSDEAARVRGTGGVRSLVAAVVAPAYGAFWGRFLYNFRYHSDRTSYSCLQSGGTQTGSAAGSSACRECHRWKGRPWAE